MNAKITITVPVNEIPKEVNKLLYSLSIKLQSIDKATNRIVDDNNINNKIIEIDDIRKKLAVLDLNYEDCYNILIGYSKYLSEKNNTITDSNIHDNSKNE